MSGQLLNQNESDHLIAKILQGKIDHCLVVKGFKQKKLPFTYLGAPLFKGKKKKFPFDDLVSKIKSRLMGWEKLTLLIAGRLMLILSTMPLYILLVILPPKGVLNAIYSSSICKIFVGM